jgi:hypothetical protein
MGKSIPIVKKWWNDPQLCEKYLLAQYCCYCGAHPNERCTTISGKIVPLHHCHDARWAAAGHPARKNHPAYKGS